MTVGIFKQLRLVLWKNYILQKRRKIGTVVELVLPVFFFAILCVIRAVISASQEPAEIYAPIPVHLTTKQIFNDSSLFSATSQFRSICGKKSLCSKF